MFAELSRSAGLSVRAPGSGRAARRQAGFTLVEAIIVVGILGILAAAASPWIAKVMRRAQLTGAARDIQATLLAERMRSVRRNSVGSVVVTPAASGESMHVVRAFEPPPPPPPTPTPAPAQYIRDLTIPRASLDFTTLPPGNIITFDGNGNLVAPPAPTPGVIVIQGPVGASTPNQITIQTYPNGRVKVITPVVWN